MITVKCFQFNSSELLYYLTLRMKYYTRLNIVLHLRSHNPSRQIGPTWPLNSPDLNLLTTASWEQSIHQRSEDVWCQRTETVDNWWSFQWMARTSASLLSCDRCEHFDHLIYFIFGLFTR